MCCCVCRVVSGSVQVVSGLSSAQDAASGRYVTGHCGSLLAGMSLVTVGHFWQVCHWSLWVTSGRYVTGHCGSLLAGMSLVTVGHFWQVCHWSLWVKADLDSSMYCCGLFQPIVTKRIVLDNTHACTHARTRTHIHIQHIHIHTQHTHNAHTHRHRHTHARTHMETHFFN